MSIWTITATALATLSPAVPYSVAPYKTTSGALPDAFIAYQLIDGSPEQHADDAETARSYLMQVTIWDRNGLFAAATPIDTALIAAGFIKGRERQLPQDPQTGHFGLAIEYSYL